MITPTDLFRKNSFPLVAAVLLLVLLLGSCQKNLTTQAPPKPFISFSINESASFANDSIIMEDFMFSPLEKNRIWTFGSYGKNYELNLTNNSWTSLAKRFGIYNSSLRIRDIASDPINPNFLWLCNFRQGLTLYNHKDTSMRNFPEIRAVNTIHFAGNYIIAGTMKGLFKIDRRNLELKNITELAELSVSCITAYNDTLLQLNGAFFYNIQNDVITGKITDQYVVSKFNSRYNIKLYLKENNLSIIRDNDTIKNMPYSGSSLDNVVIDDENIWITNDLHTGITRYSIVENSSTILPVGYEFYSIGTCPDDSLLWLYNHEGVVVFNKNEEKAYRLDVDALKPLNMIVDSKYLYVNSLHSFDIYNKEYLLQFRKSVKELADEEKKFNKYIYDQLIVFRSDFRSTYSKYEEIKKDYGSSSNKRIIIKIEQLKESIVTRLPYNFNESRELELFVMDTTNEESLKAGYYLHLIRMANFEGKLKESLYYDSILEARFPTYRTSYHKEQMIEVNHYTDTIYGLKNQKLPEDELLWRTGLAYYRLFFKVGPEGEVGYNMSYPFSYFRRLLRQHPTSPYADNAEFTILEHNELNSHEGGDNSYNLEAIENYKRILSKYPDTELAPRIYHNIAGLYSWCEATTSEKPEYYRLALKYANKVMTEFPDYGNKHRVPELINEINQSYADVMWELNISADKTIYRINEPVLISFELRNTDSNDKHIRIPTNRNYPVFTVDVSYLSYNRDSYPIEIEPVLDYSLFNGNTADTLIKTDKVYKEEWDILETARNDLQMVPGKYRLAEPGKYKITASYATGNNYNVIESNSIWINVEGRSQNNSRKP